MVGRITRGVSGDNAAHFKRAVAKLSNTKESKITRTVEGDRVPVEARHVHIKHEYRTVKGGPKQHHGVVMTMYQEQVKEVMIVLRVAANSFVRDLDRRLHQTRVVTNVQYLFRVEYDIGAVPTPKSSLEIHCRLDGAAASQGGGDQMHPERE